MITLASHVFEYFLRFFLRACVICAFLASLGSHGVTPPPFLSTLTFSSRAVPLLGFLGFLAFVRATVALASIARTITAPILLLTLRSAALLAFFFPNFAIFALVSDHLRNFSFYSWLPFWCCLLCSACLFSSLSLSPLVTSLGGLGCSSPSLVTPVFCVWRIFFL